MILGEGEETIDDLLNAPIISPQQSSKFMASESKLSITDGLWRVNGEEMPNLSSLTLKKIRKKALDRVEKEVISYVLENTAWNRSRAAKVLKISYKTLLYKIKDLGIVPTKPENQFF
jgi:DNA-binding NtrC family response regulator